MIDLILLQTEKGGDPQAVRESQKKRGASVELVDEVLAMYKEWTHGTPAATSRPLMTAVQFRASQLRKELNALQKQIGQKMKAKEDATELKSDKGRLDGEINELTERESQQELSMRRKASLIGNIVHSSVTVSSTEDDNPTIRTWQPDPNAPLAKSDGLLSHHELMYRLGILDQDRGTKVAGHRGYFLVDDGVDLNQALISYGLDFLRQRKYKRIQTPFMMRRDLMSKTAQLEDFDESLYKVEGEASTADAAAGAGQALAGDGDKYLIATSEQPLSAYHAGEWFDNPLEQLPIRYAGYSTCFRKEAGSHGKETWGLFRIHQFEKIEQFCITDPASSWTEFDSMVACSEDFYKSLGLAYRLVEIVSGALNNAAAKKYDLEAWFPYQQEWKELVSTSNCTDYQSRSLEVRCGVKKQGDLGKVYVHMLNGTLCATERAMCCLVENYQTAEGVRVPEVLRPYMGRDFLPFIRELPPKVASKKR